MESTYIFPSHYMKAAPPLPVGPGQLLLPRWGLLFLPAGAWTQRVQSAQTVAIAITSMEPLCSLTKMHSLWGPRLLNLQSPEFWEQEAQSLSMTQWGVKWGHFCSLSWTHIFFLLGAVSFRGLWFNVYTASWRMALHPCRILPLNWQLTCTFSRLSSALIRLAASG